ncbi:MAG: hypothetical protein JXN65_01180 [Clostridia bacterium]|nr:hypothetical protein [Clostridia bacterium]
MSKISNMLMDIIEQGYTMDNLKKCCLVALNPFFENELIIEKYWTSAELLSAFEFIIRYHYDEIFKNGLLEVLTCYRQAIAKDKALALDIICATLFDFSQKENMMFSVRKNVDNIDGSNLFEHTMQIMKHIGEILEIGTKHLVSELWAMLKIEEEAMPDYEKIRALDFGIITQNILDKNRFYQILKTEPISIRLSDWRNIAYHHTYRIMDESIICFYGKKGDSFSINIKDLEKYTHKIVRSSNILNIARSIVVFENLESIKKHKNKPSDISNIYFRDDLLYENLRVGLLSQSFLLDKVEISSKKASITIIDLLCSNVDNDTDKKRRIHSTQFLYEVWRVYNKAKLEVKYSTVQDGVCFISSIDSNVCKKIGNGEKEISYLAEHLNFIMI